MSRPALLAAALLLGPVISSAFAQVQPRQNPTAVDPAWLAARHDDPRIVVLHVEHGDFEDGHVPGARALRYDDLVEARGRLRSELRAPAALRERFERLGISDSTLVVVYAHEAPMAMRALFSLAYVGHDRIAYLDGGLERWRAEGRPTERGESSRAVVPRGRMTATPHPDVVVTADWIVERSAVPGLALIDTRTTGEYVGTGNRSGMPSAGHLAGARQLEWEDLFVDRSTRLRPRSELEALYRDRVGDARDVVTYCWVGYRASATWFVARLLGYDARMYDGSYQDWSQRELPTRAGTTP
jgi:thiosulfate/3-mercaptopyruvate sulfurtransferase